MTNRPAMPASANLPRTIPIDNRHCFTQRFSPTGFILNAFDSNWCHRIGSARIQVKTYPFDWVMCGFALWMFAEPARVLQEFNRVLKSGGRVALSTWAADNPSQIWCNEVLRPFVYAPAAKDFPAKFDTRFDTPLQLETALRQAGFADTQISVEEKDFVYTDEEQYWSSLWSAGFWRQLEKMTPDLLEQAKRAVFQKFRTFKKRDGFHKPNRALFAFGTKPA